MPMPDLSIDDVDLAQSSSSNLPRAKESHVIFRVRAFYR